MIDHGVKFGNGSLLKNRIDSFGLAEMWPLFSSSWIAVSGFSAVVSHLRAASRLIPSSRGRCGMPMRLNTRGFNDIPCRPWGRKGRRPCIIAYLLSTISDALRKGDSRFWCGTERIRRSVDRELRAIKLPPRIDRRTCGHTSRTREVAQKARDFVARESWGW